MNPHDNTPLFPALRAICAAVRHLAPLFAVAALFLPGIKAQTFDQFRASVPAEHLSQVQGLLGNEVHSILQDSRGYLWFGTEKGLNRYDGYTFIVYKNEPGDSSTITDAKVQSLCEDKQGVLWVGTWNGLERFDRLTGTFSNFRPDPQAGRTNVTDMTNGGDYVNVIYDVFEDSRGTLWVGGFGLKSFDRSTGRFVLLPTTGNPAEEFLRTHMVDAVFEDHLGDLWVGAAGALGRYSRSRQNWTLEWIDENIAKGLSPDFGGNHWIQRIFEDRSGLLWLCTNNGTVAFNRKNGKFTPYAIHSAAPTVDGNASIPSIAEDESGILWVGTWGDGVLTHNAEADSFELRSFYPSIPVGVPALYRDRAGTMWIGTAGQGLWKLVKENPDSIVQNRFVPPIIITEFSTFGTPLLLDTLIEENKTVKLSYKETLFSIEFAALNFIRSENNQYAYMLEGYDPQWRYCGKRRSVQYTNVAPGSYTFRVKGSNNDGVWNEQGASLAILITPPWWKTTWFSVLLWVSAFGSAAGGARFYERRKAQQKIAELEREKALEKERARISQDMHDEVGSSLSEIAILSELARRKPDQAGLRVEEISQRTTELIDNVSEIVWAMNPKNDTLEDLLGHIRRYAVKYLDLAGIACEFHAREMVSPIPVPSEIRRNLFLVVKEALHNVVKHSSASAVCIEVMLNGETFQMEIKDNGRGFAIEDRQHAGNGLANMCKRMTDIGGTWGIQSTPEGGTEILIRATVSRSS